MRTFCLYLIALKYYLSFTQLSRRCNKCHSRELWRCDRKYGFTKATKVLKMANKMNDKKSFFDHTVIFRNLNECVNPKFRIEKNVRLYIIIENF